MKWALLLSAAVILGGQGARAQGAGEDLGAKDTGSKRTALLEEMRTLPSTVKPELAGVHPRVYFTDAELKALKTKAHGPDKLLWQGVLAHLRVLQGPPPPPPAETRRAQNEVALAIAEGAFAYRIEGDAKILAATKTYMDAAVSYDVWGYSFSKPNVDLAAGHLLYGLGVAYDLLYNQLTPEERERYRAKLVRQGKLMYAAFAPRPGRTWAYSQNHTFIPIAGLAVAAYALQGEAPEATQWAQLSRAIYDRVLRTYSQDGYYYEGFEYWIFSTTWIMHYLDAQKHAAGEDLFDQPGLKGMHLYAAHSLAPGGQTMFDFGDVFNGPQTRAKEGEDYERSHRLMADGKRHFETNFNVLYDLASRYGSPQIQGVADWMRSLGHVNQEEWWTLAWRSERLPSESISRLEPWYRFPDHDVAFWRSSWDANATAVAYKCGPPEGHSAAEVLARTPDWHMEAGHVHPDVQAFILWAHGQYLTGTSGYAGVPRTAEANTLLVGGQGQGHEGGHDAWGAIPYAQLAGIRITDSDFTPQGFAITGEGAPAYDAKLGVKHDMRRITLSLPGTLRVEDKLVFEKPQTFAEVLHTDTKFGTVAGEMAMTTVGSSTLHVAEQSSAPGALKAEPNVVMGPGKPGSVDKGTLEQRGERLLFTSSEAVTTATFSWTLTF